MPLFQKCRVEFFFREPFAKSGRVCPTYFDHWMHCVLWKIGHLACFARGLAKCFVIAIARRSDGHQDIADWDELHAKTVLPRPAALWTGMLHEMRGEKYLRTTRPLTSVGSYPLRRNS